MSSERTDSVPAKAQFYESQKGATAAATWIWNGLTRVNGRGEYGWEAVKQMC